MVMKINKERLLFVRVGIVSFTYYVADCERVSIVSFTFYVAVFLHCICIEVK